MAADVSCGAGDTAGGFLGIRDVYTDVILPDVAPLATLMGLFRSAPAQLLAQDCGDPSWVLSGIRSNGSLCTWSNQV